MPLTDEQVAAVALLKTADPEEVSDALKSSANPIYTHVFNAGHQTATGKHTKEQKAIQKKLDEATSEVERLEAEIAKGPGAENSKALKDAQDEVKRVKDELKQKDTEQKERDEQRERDRVLDLTMRSLEAADATGKVRPAWIKVLRQDPELAKRIHVKEGVVSIMQAGKEIPISADDDTPDALAKALAGELRTRLAKEDPDAIQVQVDDGAGVTAGATSGGAQGYDAVKAGKEMAKKQVNAGERNKDLALR